MEQNCQNCSTLILNNFCDNCGQKRFKKIDRKYILDELQYVFIHTNKGFLYSIKKIIKSPGKTGRDFIDGNRVNHYKPILLLFLLSTVSAFISFKVIGMQEIMDAMTATNKVMNTEFMKDYMNFTKSYSALIMLLMVPVFAITTKLAFGKWGHNYYEHVIINAYVVCAYTLFTILIISPILYFFRDNYEYVVTISGFSFIAVPIILGWFFKDFYSEKPFKSIMGRVFLTFAYFLGLYVVVIILVVIGGIIAAIIYGPEAMHYFMPKQIPVK